MKAESYTPRPFIWKDGNVSWAVTTYYYGEELDEKRCSVVMFPTWREALHYANRNSDTSQKA